MKYWQKKSMLLLALCCSFSITTSAVDRSQPQDALVTKKEKDVENMNNLTQPAKDKIKEIIALAKPYNAPQYPYKRLVDTAVSKTIIEDIESSYAELTAYQSELLSALTRIDGDTSLSKKDRLDKNKEIQLTLKDTFDLWSIIGSEISSVLDKVSVSKGRHNSTIKEYLQSAQRDVSVDSFLKNLEKNIEAHEIKIEQLKKAAQDTASASADDSDQEIEEASIQKKIEKIEGIITKRYEIVRETLDNFSAVNNKILDFSRKI